MRRIMVLGVALALLLAGGALAAQTTDTAALVGTVWQWQGTRMNDDSVFTPADPASYTVEFMADGSVAIQADCNRASASYTLDGSAITITPGPATLMACPEGSLGSEFMEQLGGAAIFFFQDGELFMDIKFDSGTMHFAPAEPALVGTVWLWQGTRMNDDSAFTPADPASYTVEFMADGSVAIQADCNRASAAYTLDGSAITITPGPTTLMACPEDSLGGDFLEQLNNAAIYFFQDGDLFLDIKFDSGTMRFVAQPSGLADTTWVVTGYNNGQQAVVSLLTGTEITAEFVADGRLSGSASCNTYNTSYTTTADGGFSVGPVATTRMLCSAPEGIMEQEQAFIAALESAATYQVRGDTLEMRTADDALALMLVARAQ